jgi:hypothetical protein
MKLLNKLSTNNTFIFIIGVLSWFFSMLPSIYAELTFDKQNNWPTMILLLPILYGIVNILIFNVVLKLSNNSELSYIFNNYFFIGFIMSIFYSTLGRMSNHAQSYNIQNINMLHVYAAILYIPLYGFLFNWIDQNIK